MNPQSKMTFIWMACFVALLHLMCSASSAIDFFESKVRPILIEHCYECHSTKSGKAKGGLLLDSKMGWMKGGDLGAAIVPGDSAASLLFRAISYSDPDLEMPPSGKLSAESISAIEDWIDAGAMDPRDAKEKESIILKEEMDFVNGKKFWAFQKPIAESIPEIKNTAWPQNEIDYFILAQLEKAGIKPNLPAGDYALIRRIYIDLTGLPPTPNQIEDALSLPAEIRQSALIDRLLASRHFGETWARHWLDLARYAESTGGGRSALLPDAWRYRNYVIDAFNEDKPFDEFLREQLAGDLLEYENDAQRSEQLIATAFLVLGPKNLDLQDKELLRMNTVDEQIDTIGRVFMGMSVGCARCHDHKFDPISAKDYYALAGIFRSTRTLKRSNVSTLSLRELPTSAAHQASFEEFVKSKKALEMQIKKLKKASNQKDQKDSNDSNDSNDSKDSIAVLESRLSKLLRNAPAPLPKTLGVSDEAETADYRICIRGNVHQLGEIIPRGFLRVMGDFANPKIAKIKKGESGRREFAEWLSHPNHPLVSRVFVNRLWAHLFGEGIVRTPDNFGTQGAAPTHPKLLDYLAREFIRDEWSIKRMIRRMMLSQTYRLSSSYDSKKTAIDVENRLLWRMPLKRLRAEALRDSILMISGRLDEREVQCLFPESAQKDTALQKVSLDVASLIEPPLRSIYIPVLREEGLNPLLQSFDFANPSFPVGRRHQSILPTQALFLMNSEFVLESAKMAARKLIDETENANANDRLDFAYLQTLCRYPLERETKLARAYLENALKEMSEERAWSHIFHSLFASVDFRFLR